MGVLRDVGRGVSAADPLAPLRERLLVRRSELEQELVARVHGVSDLGSEDPDYVRGLKEAVVAALDFGLGAVAAENRGGAIPAVLFAQARQAARVGVGLDTVLRRYFAGYTVLTDAIMREAEGDGPWGRTTLRAVQRNQAALFDRLIEAVAEEYEREQAGTEQSPQLRQLQRVKRLLAGEIVDLSDFGYDVADWNLAVVGTGCDVDATIRELATVADRRLLLVDQAQAATWAWLGGRRRIESAVVAELAARAQPEGMSLALGEPGRSLTGWRLSHRQALAAFSVTLCGKPRLVRYSEVAMLAAVVQDDVLATSLRELFLAPLEEDRDGGASALATLRAFFSAGRQLSTAAAALGVTRQTVGRRLRSIEERLGRTIEACGAELDTAVRYADLVENTRGRSDPLLPSRSFRDTQRQTG